MITINNLSMGFTKRTLFNDVSLSIFPNEKIGLTGPNGSGKTTLFSIILGEQESISGTIQVQKNIRIGFLPQEASFSSTRTVMEEITGGDEGISKLMKEKRTLENEHKAHLDRYGDVVEELEQLGIYEIEHRAEKILSGLGFKEEDFHRPINELSGGWQMRTLLAKLLVHPYNLLLLDEPTNYLDLAATLWLKDFLKTYEGSFVLISHDRIFLNEVTNYTIILENERMFKIKGNHGVYEAQKSIDQKTLEKRQKVVEKKRTQLEKFAQRFHAQPNKASAVRNKRRMIDKLEKIELATDDKSISDFQFNPTRQSGDMVIRMEDIAKSYGEKKIYDDLNLEITKGQKVCLVGPNGAGKSTLLRMLADVIKPDHGKIRYGHQVDYGYFSQTRTDVLNPNKNVFEELLTSAPPGTQNTAARSLLGLFNFRGDEVFKPVKVLSGGEKSRLILAKLLINPPNFMLLDEPTTHLDLDGVKALTEAFKKYTGTVCFISHDLFFIKEIANCVIDVEGGKIKTYLGGLDYYLDKKEGRTQTGNKGADKGGASSKKKSKKKKEESSNSRLDELHNKHKEAKKRVSFIKNEISRLEKETKDLEMETYIKSRQLSKQFDRPDHATIKEYGIRLKEIQRRQREIATEIKNLTDEKKRIVK